MTTPSHTDDIRHRLANGPMKARELAELLRVSQPTISRGLAEMSDEIVRIGSARSIQYALRDTFRGLPEIPIYRVTVEGKIRSLGVLVPVRPDGFVMRQADEVTLHSEGIPWWLLDMRPQGYPNRAAAFRGFVPGGLFNVCPLALAHPAPSSRAGQTSNKPKPNLPFMQVAWSLPQVVDVRHRDRRQSLIADIAKEAPRPLHELLGRQAGQCAV
jgi:hypothetical protein